ncbi:MAG: precorrin-6Y C5,15-methyltransferase (decarboxylating) subunit CbiT [Austwickia sp.]|nr:MAG: precorrin-6Y C5,15-methyltransferase (decarboxylating) subunit CbiT [Austwickia sp.]
MTSGPTPDPLAAHDHATRDADDPDADRGAADPGDTDPGDTDRGGDADALGTSPGLPDDVFDHDGLITKRPLRACALAELRPGPGRVLWDIGTGAGSVAVEWCRAGGVLPRPATAYGVERDPVRAARARGNAERLTAPGQVTVVEGAAADDGVLAGLPRPDAVFVGGGGSAVVLDACRAALQPGGRLVAHSVTIDTEQVLVAAFRAHGGTLTRLAVEYAEPLGGLFGWKPLRAVVQWSYEAHRPTS